MASNPAIELVGIRKSFGAVTALDDVSLRVFPGEIHALMGENGAGKSTLLKILSGVLRPDEGEMRLDGEAIDARRYSPKLARHHGVAIVHQEFSLIPSLTVAQNIFLGIELSRLGVLSTAQMNERAAALLSRVGSRVSPGDLVEDLSVAQSQLVEIAKALASNVRIIALDEPSAVLSGEELESLFAVTTALAAEGVAVLYVSHRIDEVFRLASRYTVLKDGAVSGNGDIADTNPDQLISLMVGRSISQLFPTPSGAPLGEELLVARDLTVEGLAKPVDLTLRAGEIVGLAGLQGSGRTRLARGLFGDLPTRGFLRTPRSPRRPGSPASAMRSGVAYLPEDRKDAGLALQKSVGMNLSMLAWRRLSNAVGLISPRGEEALIRNGIAALSIKTDPSGRAIVGNLSGGNQQKVVIAKWLELLPEVIIFDEPTRGIDVGAKHQIYQVLRDLADSGKAVLLISSELIEVLGLSDRILVLADGEVIAELPAPDATEEQIMRLIASHGSAGKAGAA
ncbi:sugar ABC transporter ATP-binding protein [Leifsonia sp. H3M29-4]|uniref:sugar ABC transporter ATP-binding protein n=1 Tax=Salinibacterium metalliresistens TaxID=3031321 RepID=UPI0023D9A067|nr:sugar ABC transporter ATP-binding protein [Salinibacterium metalliresistens]MDF1480176.1 sugar ABC transporter ATP-binding protein [Salinibacterium metalliresistens]